MLWHTQTPSHISQPADLSTHMNTTEVALPCNATSNRPVRLGSDKGANRFFSNFRVVLNVIYRPGLRKCYRTQNLKKCFSADVSRLTGCPKREPKFPLHRHILSVCTQCLHAQIHQVTDNT
jgi:hypothetical protein